MGRVSVVSTAPKLISTYGLNTEVDVITLPEDISSSSVKIYLEETEKNIEIIFQDNGIGIPKNEINRVTERFYRVKGNEKIEGSGLGLAIVSEIMNNHEGEIKIESEEKVGTKVFLIFKRV